MRTPDGTESDQPTSAGSSAHSARGESTSQAPNKPEPYPATTSDSQGTTRSDVVFRLASSAFCTWVVLVVATSPVAHQRPAWWPWFIGIGVLLAGAMLVGAFMTLNSYLRNRY
jgi:hypothetical protein